MREQTNRISPAYIADRIVNYFNSWSVPLKEVTVVIMGKPGPRGKTWLCDNLKKRGVNAIELPLEAIASMKANMEYYDNTNHYTINSTERTAFVILNDTLPQYRNEDDFDPEVDDITTMYPKTMIANPRTLTDEEYQNYIKALKHRINSIYGSGMAGNHCYGICHEIRNKPLYTLDEVEHLIKARSTNTVPKIDSVIFNDPATIVFWNDGTKTVVKAQDGEEYDDEKGLAMAISKKALGNEGNYYNTFDKFLIKPEEVEKFECEEAPRISLEESARIMARAANALGRSLKENDYSEYGVPMKPLYDVKDNVTSYTCPVCGAVRYDEGKTDDCRKYHCNHSHIKCNPKKSDTE